MFSKKGRHNTKVYRSLPPEALLLGASCDPLMLGEVLVLCFLFLFLTRLAGFAPRGLVLRPPELMGVGVALPVCTVQPWPSLTHSLTCSLSLSVTQSLSHSLSLSLTHSLTHPGNLSGITLFVCSVMHCEVTHSASHSFMCSVMHCAQALYHASTAWLMQSSIAGDGMNG